MAHLLQSNTPIALVGLPGSGKTTVGRNFAHKYNLEFVDTDQVIESIIQCTIREYFEKEGEPAFRALEVSVIQDLLHKSNCVISTGGGAVLSPVTRGSLATLSRCAYLRASPQDLYRRLRNDKKRPLLQSANPLQTLIDLHTARDGLYREAAEYVIDTGRPSVSALVALLATKFGYA